MCSGPGSKSGHVRTLKHASLQCRLVPRLRLALLFQNLLQVIVDESLEALRDLSSRELQRRRHGVYRG